MVEVTIIQGKLAPDLKTFEAETEMPVVYRSMKDALYFAEQFMLHAKPQRIISSYYDSNTSKRIEYDTVQLYKIEMYQTNIDTAGIVKEILELDTQDDIE